nr:immunoglobulin heavy chain junction region [Mus musculus]
CARDYDYDEGFDYW